MDGWIDGGRIQIQSAQVQPVHAARRTDAVTPGSRLCCESRDSDASTLCSKRIRHCFTRLSNGVSIIAPGRAMLHPGPVPEPRNQGVDLWNALGAARSTGARPSRGAGTVLRSLSCQVKRVRKSQCRRKQPKTRQTQNPLEPPRRPPHFRRGKRARAARCAFCSRVSSRCQTSEAPRLFPSLRRCISCNSPRWQEATCSLGLCVLYLPSVFATADRFWRFCFSPPFPSTPPSLHPLLVALQPSKADLEVGAPAAALPCSIETQGPRQSLLIPPKQAKSNRHPPQPPAFPQTHSLPPSPISITCPTRRRSPSRVGNCSSPYSDTLAALEIT